MKPTYWNRFAKQAAGVVAALGMSSAVLAQESSEQRLQRLEKQTEMLQKQNESLLKLLQSSPPSSPVSAPASAPLGADGVRNIVGGYLQEKEATQKAAAATSDEGYKVGTDLRMSATWKNGFVVKTPNDDFSLHVGGWLQYDNVFWQQSGGLFAPPGDSTKGRPGKGQGVAYGAVSGGINELQDGTYFRRIRLVTDGKFWENYEYTLTLALENNQFSTVGLDEFWVGATNIPVIGTARIGHVKNAIGLEADMSGSSKTMTFLERSSYSEAIELNQNFVTGIWLGNNYFDQRATWSATVFRPDNGASSGAIFGNDQWGAQGRLTALPIYENEGRHLLHAGVSGGYRSNTATLSSSPLHTIQLRARPELRDDDPAGSPSGGQAVPNANSNRMVDTGVIASKTDFLMGTELLYILGPFSAQAEYGWNFVRNATGFAPSGLTLNPALPGATNYTFNGGYVQLAYTLTGENRSYDKRLGRLDSFYFGRKGPNSNAWLVRDEDGRLNMSIGAWEIAARYSHINLNDGSGLSRIQGGQMDGLTLGLNWYLNDNMKFQFDYVYDHRYDMPTNSNGTAFTNGGSTRGFGMRMQFMY